MGSPDTNDKKMQFLTLLLALFVNYQQTQPIEHFLQLGLLPHLLNIIRCSETEQLTIVFSVLTVITSCNEEQAIYLKEGGLLPLLFDHSIQIAL